MRVFTVYPVNAVCTQWPHKQRIHNSNNRETADNEPLIRVYNVIVASEKNFITKLYERL